MQTGTNTNTSKRRSKKVVGRQDSQGQEAVIENDVIEERIDELITLKKSAEEASTSYSDAVKATAEKSGYNAATVRKYVEAKAGDDFDGAKKKVAQLALIFDIEN